MRRKSGNGRWLPDEGPGNPVSSKRHYAGELVVGARHAARQADEEPPEPPEDHGLSQRTLDACRDAIWEGDLRQQRYGRAVIEFGSVRRAAEELGVSRMRVYQVLGLAKAA